MKPILAALAMLACTSCANSPFSRVRFTVGYGEATVGIEADIRDTGKNPIASRRRSGK